ncbi:MAG: sulfur carrier protein ThiS adenylyltransferase ThiF [Candidatus Hydrogenedens sp.]
MIHISVNEKEMEVPEGISLQKIKEKYKPDADIIIWNGLPVNNEIELTKKVNDKDHLVFIKRGEIPSYDELEFLMVARHSPGVHEKVKKSIVGIAGLGGLGSTVAIALTRLGIGKLILADFDVVEPSNLNRQQYYIKNLGMYKTDAMREILKDINPYVDIETYTEKINPDNIQRIFTKVHILVEAFDTAEGKRMLIENFHKYYPNKVIVSASGLAGYFSSNSLKVRKVTSYLYIVGDEENSAGPRAGLMSPRVGIAGNLQANTVLRIIMGELTP